MAEAAMFTQGTQLQPAVAELLSELWGMAQCWTLLTNQYEPVHGQDACKLCCSLIVGQPAWLWAK